jgi:hypothetical protein
MLFAILFGLCIVAIPCWLLVQGLSGNWIFLGVFGSIVVILYLLFSWSESGCDNFKNDLTPYCIAERHKKLEQIESKRTAELKALDEAISELNKGVYDAETKRLMSEEMRVLYKKGRCGPDISQCIRDIHDLAFSYASKAIADARAARRIDNDGFANKELSNEGGSGGGSAGGKASQ